MGLRKGYFIVKRVHVSNANDVKFGPLKCLRQFYCYFIQMITKCLTKCLYLVVVLRPFKMPQQIYFQYKRKSNK